VPFDSTSNPDPNLTSTTDPENITPDPTSHWMERFNQCLLGKKGRKVEVKNQGLFFMANKREF
jgi:hypothetical protein